MQEHHIVTDYCIGSEKEVASVAIFSEVPINEVDTLLLDYQSRTYVNLAKVLLKHYWKKEVHLKEATEDFRNHITGTTAAVVIGDRALEQRKISAYTYDLATAWKAMTGLPFVFAAWVSNKQLSDDFQDAFNRANGYGIRHLDEVLQEVKYDQYDLHKYYTENISYQLTEEKRKGLAMFLEYLKDN